MDGALQNASKYPFFKNIFMSDLQDTPNFGSDVTVTNSGPAVTTVMNDVKCFQSSLLMSIWVYSNSTTLF